MIYLRALDNFFHDYFEVSSLTKVSVNKPYHLFSLNFLYFNDSFEAFQKGTFNSIGPRSDYNVVALDFLGNSFESLALWLVGLNVASHFIKAI